MKTKFAFTLLLGAALFSACGNKAADTNGTKTDSTATAKDSVPVVKEEPAPKMSAGESLMRGEAVGDVYWGMNLNELADVLGDAEKVQDGGDGGYTTNFYPKKGYEVGYQNTEERMAMVESITAIKPCTGKTKRGIGIGSTAEEVREKYKDVLNETESREDYIVAGDLFAGVFFNIEKGKVSRIFIGIGAE